MEIYDIFIIGSGSAGLSAAIYAARSGLRFAVVEQAAVSGGQMLNTNEIENYPGLWQTDGYTLSDGMRRQAEALGTIFVRDRIGGLLRQGRLWHVQGEKETYCAKTVVIAAGARHRKLQIDGEDRLCGHGVSYCAVCDGAFFKNRVTAVIGGGNTAAEEALHLARFCEKVYLIHRRDTLRADVRLQKKINETENIRLLLHTQVLRIEGDSRVSGLILQNGEYLATDGVFVAVGIQPNSEPYVSVVRADEGGFLCANETCVTSAPGVFAAGDIRTKALRQIVTAAADGANAIASAQKYIEEM